MPEHVHRAVTTGTAAGILVMALVASGCTKSPIAHTPPTIEPARAVQSPPLTAKPAGQVLPLAGSPRAAAFDGSTGSLVVFTPAGDIATLQASTQEDLRLMGSTGGGPNSKGSPL